MYCNFDALLFDLGGTLIYFEGDKREVIHQADRVLARAVQGQGYDISTKTLIDAY
jgi:hypothetical protein